MSKNDTFEITDSFKNAAKVSYWMGIILISLTFITIFFPIVFFLWLTMFLPFGIFMLNDGRYYAKTRFVIINNSSIQFILPKYFGGMKIFEVFWSKIEKITVKNSHLTETTRYYFSFQLPDSTETFRILTNRTYSEYIVFEIIDVIEKIAQKKGIIFVNNLRSLS